jgi:hypothetical protein
MRHTGRRAQPLRHYNPSDNLTDRPTALNNRARSSEQADQQDQKEVDRRKLNPRREVL